MILFQWYLVQSETLRKVLFDFSICISGHINCFNFNMYKSIGWGLIKKFICHILGTPRLSHSDTIIIVIVNMERPCYHGNYRNTLIPSSIAIVTVERSCCNGNYRDTFIMSSVARITTERVFLHFWKMCNYCFSRFAKDDSNVSWLCSWQSQWIQITSSLAIKLRRLQQNLLKQ